ncbi:MAG: DEAD/DEAH box helicase [Thermoanaerobaculales bacterium]|nr:DEAD/DEAH box helicase [Thermoanaerobaculales bacterium]
MTETTSTNSLFSSTRFAEFDLPEQLLRAIADLGFERLTQVQDQVLPFSLKGTDVVAQAQTGSGKTAAYLITAFNRILTVPRESEPTGPRALVVTPTRELAVQVSKDAEALAAHTDLKVHVVFGGMHYKKQRATLSEGVDLLIGTPGSLIDYHRQGAYSLRETEVAVIDECDRLFDMGFAEDLRWILRRLPNPRNRQTLMFTATLSRRVTTLGWREMDEPEEIVVDREQITPQTILQELYHVSRREKFSLLLGLLKREGDGRTMIFVNTRISARRLVDDLQRHGFTARGLTGNVEQIRRLRVLDQFRDGELPILVATDVASRGLHIEGVTHVVNYDLPQDAEDYVHRIGRTARVGAEGKAFTLACEDYVYSLDAVQKFVGYEIPTVFADDGLYAEVKPGRRPRPSNDQRRQPSRPPDRATDTGSVDAVGEQRPKRRPRRRRPRKKPNTGDS